MAVQSKPARGIIALVAPNPYPLFPVLKRCFNWGNPKNALFATPYPLI